ncbi:phosphoribosyl-aminoimidazole-succinocarboxamide synthase [Cordyceps militaris]|uniref:Phosphoribosyl-aminoimidazole-succinocarboxamide synthase n=1 Tax=Cordyceps militaris TaxID=73501 RepID=A0A2H4SPV7_CORMI|nr:phosphoribosyl-aminoimidazole-succinocarboxamide synthase [Cordyceps militaris]
MSCPTSAGVLQTHQLLNDNSILIRDEIYGEELVSEPVLVELLQSAEVQRLQGICQHGVTGFLGITPRVTRLEHSVGAFILVRRVGAALDEQVAALLHDISHTTLSHVIDHALSKPGEGSYHEVHKARYLKTTRLPDIVAKHGISQKVFEEELFPLVEMPSPQLCADRLDYALRDAVSFGKLAMEDAQKVVSSLRAFPSATTARRLLVLDDAEVALTLSRAYTTTDKDVWSNPAHIDMYERTGRVIGELVEAGSVEDKVLWQVSDAEFWTMLRQAANPEQRRAIERLETEGVPEDDGLELPHCAKIRTLDPDVWQRGEKQPAPLSIVLPTWGTERQQYILSRTQHR